MTRRLIEEGLPFTEINQASHREKSGNAPSHPRRLHLWWARRPLAMSRAIVLGSLIPDPNDPLERQRIFNLIRAAALFKDAKVPANVAPLRALVSQAFPAGPPMVLDSFAGGGAIPLEALRLGCDTTAVDLNPVAYLIQRCMLEYPQEFGQPDSAGRNSLADDVRRWADWAGRRAQERVAAAYPAGPDGTQPAVWFWARTMPCPNPSCGIKIPLVKSWWLARARRLVWLQPEVKDGEVRLNLRTGEPPSTAHPNRGTVNASSVTCPGCASTVAAVDVRAYGKAHGFGTRLLAVLEIDGRERTYRAPTDADVAAPKEATVMLADLKSLPDGTSPLPHERCDPAQHRTLRYLIFGLRSFRELFTDRQLLAAAALCEAIRDAHEGMLEEHRDAGRARAAATYLGLLLSRVVDYNSSFCSFDLSRDMPSHTYGRQSIPMIWDFTEIDPFIDVPGNWSGGIDSMVGAIEHCSAAAEQPGHVMRGDAQDLSAISDATFDAVIVDPPYYDAVQYADLSDYFYVWLKRSIGHLYPELFSTPLTPKRQEVIENRADKKSDAYISSAEFETRLARSVAEMRRVVKSDGVVSIVFAHTESDAWERLLRALLQADLVVSTSWPMQSEMRSRSTANISAVLGSSVVLVCRPRVVHEPAYYEDVVRELDARIAARMDEFEQMGLVGADYLISAIGPAFEVFGQYSQVLRYTGEEVSIADLLALARRTVARHAMRRLLGSENLAQVDDLSLLYLTWRWAYGAAKIPVDEAQKLGKAFNVEVDELDGIDGMVERARDSYALRSPAQRKKIPLGVSPTLIDVLQLACQLHNVGRRRELGELLGATGMAGEPTFWSAGRAIAESLPDGERERTMLVNLLGSRDQVVEAASKSSASLEELRLFEVDA